MRKYIEKVGTEYLIGKKRLGGSPRRYSDYTGRYVTAMSYGEKVLYSYSQPIALIKREEKILYLNNEKISLHTEKAR